MQAEEVVIDELRRIDLVCGAAEPGSPDEGLALGARAAISWMLGLGLRPSLILDYTEKETVTANVSVGVEIGASESLALVVEQHVSRVLAESNQNRVQAAKKLGIGVSTLYRFLGSPKLSRPLSTGLKIVGGKK